MEKEDVMKSIDLSGCEKIIMGSIYEYHRKYEEVPNLKDIMVIVEGRYGIEWKLQTVCTFLSRMEKKALLHLKELLR